MSRLRLAYLFTTFPETSETFLQREVRAMRAQPVDCTLHSLWGGKPEWEGQPVDCFDLSTLGQLAWWLPYWLARKPRVFLEIATVLTRRPPPSALNLGENLLGFAYALIHARGWEKLPVRPHLCHAVWATAPAAAAWMFERLLGIPYTMGAHAYDVFQHGGDWLLEEKLHRARLVHTTTASTRARLLALGANSEQVVLIRRGLDAIPSLPPRRAPGKVLYLLAIGRLIPKKGYFELLGILAHLRSSGVAFECRIVGGGPLEPALRARIRELNLEKQVQLLGMLPYSATAQLQREWADVFLFTGLVAPDGDRDGLPNVIPEAMAVGLPVITSLVAGTTEAIVNSETGWVVALDDWAGWRAAIISATRDTVFTEKIRLRAHTWVANNFDASRNASALANAIRHTVLGRRSEEN
jgi:glycosyltransferase involved in cell wall biosynthesis